VAVALGFAGALALVAAGFLACVLGFATGLACSS